MTASALRIDAEKLPALQHLEPGAHRALRCPPPAAIDGDLPRPGKETLLSPSFEAGPREVIRLRHEGDPPVQGKGHEEPVGEREMIAGQDGRPPQGDVLDAFLNRLENFANGWSQNNILQHPVDASTTSTTGLDPTLGVGVIGAKPIAHVGTVLPACPAGGG